MRGGGFYDKLIDIMITNEIAEKTKDFIKEMFEKGMHLGYSQTSRNPKMEPYLFGVKSGVEIFDLEKTRKCLDDAASFVKKTSEEGGMILFVGTKKEAKKEIEKLAGELNLPYVIKRWVGGTLTNFKEIKSRVDCLIDLKAKKESGELDKYTKKERLQMEKKTQKLERRLGGLENLKDYPSALVVIDPKHEKISVDEAADKNIPVIALMNSDCDPSDIAYPVPANDSSLSSIIYFLSQLASAFKEGAEARKIKQSEPSEAVAQLPQKDNLLEII